MRCWKASLVGVCLVLAAGTAIAATETGSFIVRLVVTASCALGASTDLDFGSVSALASNMDATTSLQVTCTNGAAYNIGLSRGLNGTGVSDRKMKATVGTSTVSYQLYRDAGRAQVWGETIGTDTVGGSGSGGSQTLTVYSRIPSQSGLSVGLYTDTITITLTY